MPGRDEVGLRLGNSIPPVSQVQNCTTTKLSSVQAPTIGSVHDGNDDSVVRLFMNLLCMGYRISIHLCLTFTYAASPQCNIKVVILKVASFFITIHLPHHTHGPAKDCSHPSSDDLYDNRESWVHVFHPCVYIRECVETQSGLPVQKTAASHLDYAVIYILCILMIVILNQCELCITPCMSNY